MNQRCFHRRPLAVALLGFIAVAATAQEKPAVKKNADVETIEVWGTQVTASSLSLDAEAMEIRQPDHISDLLRIIPGVDVGGAHSLNQRITIRSMDDKDLRISIDGANQNTFMYHHMGNLQIHADILESAEIDVGNNSVINGGLGGAVRFKTKEAKHLLQKGDQFGGRVQASYGDNAGDSYALTGYGQLTDSLDVLAYFNHVKRDNYEVGGGKILDQYEREIPDTHGEVIGLEGELEDALIKFGWDISPGQRLKLGYESYTDEGDYSYRPDMGLATTLTIAGSLKTPNTFPTKFTRDTTTLSYEAEFAENSTLEASLYRNESTFWRDERGLIKWMPPLATINQGDADNTGFNVFANTNIADGVDHSITYGLDHIQYETAFIIDRKKLAGEEAKTTAIFLEDKIITNEGFNFIPGVRYESVDVDSNVISKTFSDVTASLAAEYEANDTLLFRISGTELFKSPEISEVFGTGAAGFYDLPNADIKAETGINQQISAAYKDAVLGADNFSLGITFFKTEIDNYIYDYYETPTREYFKDNLGDMEVEGYEAYAGYDLDSLKILLTYSSAESELAAFDNYKKFDGARIDRQQGDTLSLSLDYTIAPANLSLHWDTLWVDDVDPGKDLDGATFINSKEGFVVSNVSAHWKPEALGGVAFTLGVDNLFDRFYASQSSRTGTSKHPRFGELYLMDYEPGRNAKFTVSYTF